MKTLIFVIFLCLINSALTFICPPDIAGGIKSIASGSNHVFDAIAECSYQFVADISTEQATKSADATTKLIMYNGKLSGAWSYARYYDALWWCTDNNRSLAMAAYIGVAGAALDYNWRLVINRNTPITKTPVTSSSCSADDGTSCGGVEIVKGHARLYSEFVDGVVTFALPAGKGKACYVTDFELEYYPYSDALYDQVTVFDPAKAKALSNVYKEFIKTKMFEAFLEAVKDSIWNGINQCLPLADQLMRGFAPTVPVVGDSFGSGIRLKGMLNDRRRTLPQFGQLLSQVRLQAAANYQQRIQNIATRGQEMLSRIAPSLGSYLKQKRQSPLRKPMMMVMESLEKETTETPTRQSDAG